LSSREKLSLIEKSNSAINLTRQAELLDISRSGIYYQPIIDPREIQIKNTVDEIYTACPFYGSRKIKKELEINHQIKISRGYVQNLMREMGLQAIYPSKKLNLSQRNKQHKKYPYLLKNLEIVRINQVWSTDITYVRLKNGFAYLTVIFDWYSRYVISWKLSATLENDFCIQALKEALEIAKPEIHNSDQGVQYTAENYIAVLEEKGIQISMDGRGRCMDNIFTERLWRTVKYENIYLYDYQNIEEARVGLTEYFQFYNHRRIHQSLNYQIPAQIYLPNNQLIFKNQIHLIEAKILSWQTVHLKDHLKVCEENIISLYEEFKNQILNLDDKIEVMPKKKYIAFKASTNFIDIIPQKKSIKFTLNVCQGELNNPYNLGRDVSNIGKYGNGDYEFSINSSVDFINLMPLIKQSYERNK